MKTLISVIVLCIILSTSSLAYAGDAWPWIVGGVAGVWALGHMMEQNRPQTTTVIHHQPVYRTVYRPVYTPAITGTYVYPGTYTTQTIEYYPTYSPPAYYGY